MKNPSKLLPLFATVVPLCVFGQSVTINVNTAGYEDGTGTPANGMAWGFVVDTTGAGFAGLTSSSLLADASFPAFDGDQLLSFTTGESGIYFLRADVDTQNSGPGLGSVDGYIGDYQLGVGAGDIASPSDPYGLVWFPTSSLSAGDPYGFELLGTLPAGGGTDNVNTTVFSADYTVAVPEPSHFALAFGLIGLGAVVWRRRRRTAKAE